MMTRSAQITLTVVSFLLGLLLVTQFYTQRKLASASQTQSTADQAMIISGLVEGNAALRKEVAALESETANYDLTSGEANLENMVSELNKLRILNGLVEVAGPGVEIKISGSVTALDLQDLMNEVAECRSRGAGPERLPPGGAVGGSGCERQHPCGREPADTPVPAAGHRRSAGAGAGADPQGRVGRPAGVCLSGRRDKRGAAGSHGLAVVPGKYEFRYARTAR